MEVTTRESRAIANIEPRAPIASVAVANTASDASREFALFPKLPPELRDMVWKFMLPDPRILNLLCHRPTHTDQEPILFSHDPVSKANINVVATPLLHTCSRSRQIALGRYERAFDGLLNHPIYFDWERDTVYMKLKTSFAAFTGGWRRLVSTPTLPQDVEVMRAKIQHMAIHRIPLFYLDREDMVEFLYGFPKLSVVTWVWPPLEGWGSGEVLYRRVQEMQIRESLKDLWEKKTHVEKESTLPQMEFVTEEQMKARIGD
jgi:2EXR family